MVMEVVHEDMGEGSMQCTNHPYKNSTPGGICAFCLQEKLGKLVSSSFPVSTFPSSSSSSSSRSDLGGSNPTSAAADATAAALQAHRNDCNYLGYYSRRSRLPFILTQKKKKAGVVMGSSDSSNIIFKRSKSTATPRRGMHFSQDYSPRRRGFWSFLTAEKGDKNLKDLNFTSSSVNGGGVGSRERKREDFVVVGENGGFDHTTFERKVSRSRSVGCGSRSFSGDLFERISTGFGDCTLRRVESQREGKAKVQGVNGQDCIKERVRCGGIFGGFMTTSSLSSSSSSLYWVSSSAENNNGDLDSNSKSFSHGRSKSWGWALASPMRAFSKPPLKRDGNGSSDKNVTPNLAAIPSLLVVG